MVSHFSAQADRTQPYLSDEPLDHTAQELSINLPRFLLINDHPDCNIQTRFIVAFDLAKKLDLFENDAFLKDIKSYLYSTLIFVFEDNEPLKIHKIHKMNFMILLSAVYSSKVEDCFDYTQQLYRIAKAISDVSVFSCYMYYLIEIGYVLYGDTFITILVKTLRSIFHEKANASDFVNLLNQYLYIYYNIPLPTVNEIQKKAKILFLHKYQYNSTFLDDKKDLELSSLAIDNPEIKSLNEIHLDIQLRQGCPIIHNKATFKTPDADKLYHVSCQKSLNVQEEKIAQFHTCQEYEKGQLLILALTLENIELYQAFIKGNIVPCKKEDQAVVISEIFNSCFNSNFHSKYHRRWYADVFLFSLNYFTDFIAIANQYEIPVCASLLLLKNRCNISLNSALLNSLSWDIPYVTQTRKKTTAMKPLILLRYID